MFKENLLKSGWIHALLIAFIIYPISAITQKFVASYAGGNLLAYTSIFTLSSSCALLIIAGPGELILKTLRRPETWIYAILQIVSYLLFLFSLKYISATEGATLALLGGLFILILSFLFLHQKLNKIEVLGGLIMLFGFYLVIKNTPLTLESKAILIAIVSIRGLVICGQKMIAEIHKTNRNAKDFKTQVRVVGFVMSAASFVFLLFLINIALVKENNTISFLEPFPYLTDFLNFQVWLIAIVLGFIVVSASKYCEFYAGKTIGARYLMAITSLQIVFIYFLEFVLANFNIFESRIFSINLIIALGFVMVGNILIAIAGFFKDLKFIKKGEKQDTLANMEGNFIDNEEDFNIVKMNLSNILTLYNGETEKVAKSLDISKMMIDNILHYDLYEVKLSRKLAKKINNFASMNVSLKDKLTKAYNRYYLEQKTKKLFEQKEDFKLYYLDLNNFKPVNDTYGHDAGDEVLVETVKRLESIVKESGFVVRLGGDEFVIVQLKNIQDDLSSKISESLEKTIKVKSTKEEINISTSIGICESCGYNDFEEMLNKADANMFKDKDNR